MRTNSDRYRLGKGYHKGGPVKRWLELGGFLLLALTVLFAPVDAARSPGRTTVQAGQPLTLATRLACQTAVEEVYWANRTWPAENPDPKPDLAEVMPPAAVEAQVLDSLAQSQALAEYWHQPITPAMLQAEIDRQAAGSQRPDVLRSIWAALNNDPLLIAECLARPVLANRLIHNWFRGDERFAGRDFGDWWAATRDTLPIDLPAAEGEYYLPPLSQERAPAQDDTWQDTAAIPIYSLGEAVWTGAEMLFLSEFRTQGHRYNPATDTWDDMTTINAPHRVRDFTAVWSGTEMITWGGCTGTHEFCTTHAGGRYNPATDTWTATQLTGAPGPRRMHAAVWTGSAMIVWGGCTEDSNGNQNCNIILNDGGRYDPGTDSWLPVTSAGAPAGRRNPDVVWTDDEMIVWSGTAEASPGGRYNPSTNSWQGISTASAPIGRFATLVWTGSEMIAWGGCTGFPDCDTTANNGGRYNPDTNVWTPVSTAGAPPAGWGHRAIWTGSEMIVWGGYNGSVYTNSGGRYDPASNSWTAVSTANAPSGRSDHQLFWTGSEALVWGGWGAAGSTGARNGARYHAASNTWTPISAKDPYSARTFPRAIWTGVEMIAWGGIGDGIVGGLDTGRIYDPVVDTWEETSTANAPSPRDAHTVLWTGTEMIAWGGNTVSWSTPGTGGRYNPMSDTWIPTTTSGAPEAPAHHSAVWTGSEMIVWGGSVFDSPTSDGGGRYDPGTDSWAPISAAGAPAGRYLHTAVWTGSAMVIWGGQGETGAVGSGGRYYPATNSWSPTTMTGVPAWRVLHTAIWTGSEMIVWGGTQGTSPWVLLNSGGRYDPVADTWTPTTTTAAPPPAARHTAVWTGDEMIVWGGCYDNSGCLHGTVSGGRYDPQANTWTATSMVRVPEARFFHSAVWTGSEMIVWGGETENNGYGHTGGRYFAAVSGNNAPQANNDAYSVGANTTLTVPAPGVLANDSDPDGDPLTATLVTSPTHGSLTLQGDGSFVYVPDVDYSGPDNFSYRASDGQKLSNVAVVGITIGASNSPPVAEDDFFATNQDTLLVVPAPGVLGNDSDVDGDPLIAVLASNPTHGTVALDPDGSFSYQPAAGYSGSDSFTYTIEDGQGGSDTATVTITINGQPPFLVFLPVVLVP